MLKIRYQAAIFAYACVVLYFLATPRPVDPVPGFPLKNLFGHFLLLGGMAFVIERGIRGSYASPRAWLAFLIPALAAAAYGTFLEVIQLAIPSRSFEWLDITMNTLGAFTASSVMSLWAEWSAGRRAVKKD